MSRDYSVNLIKAARFKLVSTISSTVTETELLLLRYIGRTDSVNLIKAARFKLVSTISSTVTETELLLLRYIDRTGSVNLIKVARFKLVSTISSTVTEIGLLPRHYTTAIGLRTKIPFIPCDKENCLSRHTSSPYTNTSITSSRNGLLAVPQYRLAICVRNCFFLPLPQKKSHNHIKI
ncbi:hypothetical protein J6590_028368 [Homalodisca vitripennis]|nr:hypothetical protein J6590_028368 [Homalodisca vitripennis]